MPLVLKALIMKPLKFSAFIIDFSVLNMVKGMRHIILGSLLFLVFEISNAKEWRCLRIYQKETGKTSLGPSDWLKKDRNRNSEVWQKANLYNLKNNLPFEYQTIKQRSDFYHWYIQEIKTKGHEVLWPEMSHFISRKLALTKVFPYCLFVSKEVKEYAYLGSADVFNSCFDILNKLLLEDSKLVLEEALAWDKTILYEEQYRWLVPIYQTIDDGALVTIERMAKGMGFYSLMVPKRIRFKGDITKEEERYHYALNVLRPYFEKVIED